MGRGPREADAGPDGVQAESIARYRRLLKTTPRLLARLPALRGKSLACWCRHDGEARTAESACHAAVLPDLLDRHADAEPGAMGDER